MADAALLCNPARGPAFIQQHLYVRMRVAKWMGGARAAARLGLVGWVGLGAGTRRSCTRGGKSIGGAREGLQDHELHWRLRNRVVQASRTSYIYEMTTVKAIIPPTK